MTPWPEAPSGTRWLLRLPNWVGDAIMVLPAVRALLGPEHKFLGVANPRSLPIYEATGWFEQVLPARGARAPLELGEATRSWRADRAVSFTRPVSGAMILYLSRARLRLGRGTALRRSLLTHRLPPEDRGIPLHASQLQLAEAAGGNTDAPLDFTLDPGAAARDAAERLLAGTGDAVVALAPGAAYGPAKRWPVERFRELAGRLRARGCVVVGVGGPGDRELVAELGADRDLAGATSLPEMIAVLAACRAVVSNDSGAMHLARAAGTPVAAVFGSSSPAWTAPTAGEGVVIRRTLSCSPCFRRECPLEGDEHLRCLREITVDEVEGQVGELLSGGKP